VAATLHALRFTLSWECDSTEMADVSKTKTHKTLLVLMRTVLPNLGLSIGGISQVLFTVQQNTLTFIEQCFAEKTIA